MEQELKKAMEQELKELYEARKIINKRVSEIEEVIKLRVDVRALTEVIKAINNVSNEYRDEIAKLNSYIKALERGHGHI